MGQPIWTFRAFYGIISSVWPNKGSFPVGSRLSLFLLACGLHWINPSSRQPGRGILSLLWRVSFWSKPLSRPPLYRCCSSNGNLCGKRFHLSLSRRLLSVSREQVGGRFYSHYFLATKRTGGFFPIYSQPQRMVGFAPYVLNLSGLNKYVHVSNFCMETLSSVLQGLRKGWLVDGVVAESQGHLSACADPPQSLAVSSVCPQQYGKGNHC